MSIDLPPDIPHWRAWWMGRPAPAIWPSIPTKQLPPCCQSSSCHFLSRMCHPLACPAESSAAARACRSSSSDPGAEVASSADLSKGNLGISGYSLQGEGIRAPALLATRGGWCRRAVLPNQCMAAPIPCEEGLQQISARMMSPSSREVPAAHLTNTAQAAP